MTLRLQLLLLFVVGGLVLSDAAQARTAPCCTMSGEKASALQDTCPKK